jgi:ribonucleotide reductase beta subunit family protein with ferritin-like domain
MRNVGLAVMEKMTAPELQIYQARQVFEEALHTWTYQHYYLAFDQSKAKQSVLSAIQAGSE